MNLVTTCPRCRTSFRVVADQLRLRGGLVRCGACHAVFSGLEEVRRPTGERSSSDSLDAGAEDYAPDRSGLAAETQVEAHVGAHAGTGTEAVPGPGAPPDVDARTASAVSHHADDRPGRDDEVSSPVASQGFAGSNRALKLAAAAVLLAAIPLQLAIGNRDWLAARFPALEPAIRSLVTPLGLDLDRPRSLDSLSIQSFEMAASGQPGVFSATAILRNDASHAVRWPSMLLTLTDAAEGVLVRRIIDPRDYLGPAADGTGLRAHSERQVRLALEGEGLEPARYSVSLFYR